MNLFDVSAPPSTTKTELGAHNYYPTKAWFAEALVDRDFSDLPAGATVLEPTCGDGAFLNAIREVCPSVKRIGIELQPELARIARAHGHEVIVGDILLTPLPERIHAAIGNPPFNTALIDSMLDRLHGITEDGAKLGFILPAYYWQTANHVTDLRDKWSIRVELIPRNVFDNLEKPLVWSLFTRNAERRIVGLAFYDETAQALSMHARIQKVMTRTERRGVWPRVFEEALEMLGGTATLQQIYRVVEPRRPTPNPAWQEQLRKIAGSGYYPKVGEATYSLPRAA